MKKVLILTAGFGEGHNAAARNLKAAFDELLGQERAHVHDLFADSSPRINSYTRQLYLWLINKYPRLWSWFYAWIDKNPIFPRHLWFLRKETALLSKLIRETQPCAICCTFPAYAFMANALCARGVRTPPLFNIVTDSISINSLWTRPKCDGWFVPNHETKLVVARQGVPENLIHVCGFPVQLVFARDSAKLNPPTFPTRPKVLYILHSGLRNAEATAEFLLRNTDYELTFAVGRDEKLRTRLSKIAEGRREPTTILSWTDKIPSLLMTHHVVISKAGGATTQEAIAARCPMVVNQIVPGQEEGNYELLRSRNIGFLAETPAEIVEGLKIAFDNDGAIWSKWRTSLDSLSAPTSSLLIARAVLTATDSNTSSV